LEIDPQNFDYIPVRKIIQYGCCRMGFQWQSSFSLVDQDICIYYNYSDF